MASIFTKIINGEIPCYKIAENNNFIAFLDVNPLKLGHTLIVPKIEVDYIFNNSDETLSEILVFSKKIAKAIEKTVNCSRIAITVIGLEVPHTHIHLIPINKEAEISFSNPRLKLTNQDFIDILDKIKGNL